RRAEGGGRAARWTFLGAWTAIGVAKSVRPVLPGLVDDRWSLIVALLSLAPIVWLAIVDHWTGWRYLSSPIHAAAAENLEQTEGRLAIAALGGAGLLAVASAALVPLLMREQFEPDLLSAGLGAGLLWTFAGLSAIVCAAFL